MLRETTLEQIWDGRFYDLEDMVPIGCHDCEGCSDCCKNTGDSIILDPYDMYRLTKGLHKSFEEMMEKEIEIRVVDGLILPNLMEHDEFQPEREDGCPFLGTDGRCSIHAYRPGFCRMFPVGRYYTENGFRYFVQRDECQAGGERYEVRLSDWLDTPDLPRYEVFVQTWHDFCKLAASKMDLLTDRSREQVQRALLQIFYVEPYPGKKDFYLQFAARMEQAKKMLRPLGLFREG